MVAEIKRVLPKEYPTYGIEGVMTIEGYGFEEMEENALAVGHNDMANPGHKPFTLQTNISPAKVYRNIGCTVEALVNVQPGSNFCHLKVHIIVFQDVMFKEMWDNSENLVETTV